MKFSAIIAAALATTGVSAYAKNGTEPTKWETTVVTAYTTYCPVCCQFFFESALLCIQLIQ